MALGHYQLIIASPEYVEQDFRFRTYLWNSASFCKLVQRLVFDEAHCVMDWGGFRPAYLRMCFLRLLLPHATFLAMTATLTPTMASELKRHLGLFDVELVRRSNDRCNIVPIVRGMRHTVHSLHDLAFLIPLGLTSASPPPPKFMLFMNSRDLCLKAGQFLRARLPANLQGHVIWVHSDMSSGFNERAMVKLREATIYGVVCTDVAGMVSPNHNLNVWTEFILLAYFRELTSRTLIWWSSTS